VPDGVSLAPIERESGEPGIIGRPGVILEAFRPGTEPQRGASAVEESLSFGTGSLTGFEALLLGVQEGDDEEEDEELGDLY
jgi:penicillin-binding protein 1A